MREGGRGGGERREGESREAEQAGSLKEQVRRGGDRGRGRGEGEGRGGRGQGGRPSRRGA